VSTGRSPRAVTLFALGALFALGTGHLCCTLLTNFDESLLDEETYERCKDSADNDGDGLTDCDDPACAPFGSLCKELTPESCEDDEDNDIDGLIDCLDPGCAALTGVCVEKTVKACTDEQDNDGDGKIDCNDSDCRELEVCQERSAASCTDGVDNDNDGLMDCNDFDCYDQPGCCSLPPATFLGDDFSNSSGCKPHVCSKQEPSCCLTGYERCSGFAVDKWVAWGLPRARLDGGAFVANEPCGCESSGVVSVEWVPLEPGLKLDFDLKLTSITAPPNGVCVGLTVSTSFPDDLEQCSAMDQPQLLTGICLEIVQATAGLETRVSAITDNKVQEYATATSGAPVTASIEITKTGVQLNAGPLGHKTSSIDKTIKQAFVMVHGTGTSATVDNVKVKLPIGADKKRCQAPGVWYRHLARGEPVVPATATVLGGNRPTVIYHPPSKSYLMLVEGEVPGASGYPGLFAATSEDGLSWTFSDKPVIPASKSDTSFGEHQTSPSLLYWRGLYHLWYTRQETVGSNILRGIAHATSTDGKTWKHAPNSVGGSFVLDAGQPHYWDAKEVSSPTVVVSPIGGLLMWYSGARTDIGARPAIGVAELIDGKWSRQQAQKPVLEPEPGTADLGYEDPMVIYDAAHKLYRMWYTRRVFGRSPEIHYAVSENGAAFTRWPAGPALQAGPSGTFEERGVTAPGAIFKDGRVMLWYTGIDGKGGRRLGYAENRGAP
jgi:hypothetical protein